MDKEFLVLLKNTLYDLGEIVKGSLAADQPSLYPIADSSTEPPVTQQKNKTSKDTTPKKKPQKTTIYGQKHDPNNVKHIPVSEPENQATPSGSTFFGER